MNKAARQEGRERPLAEIATMVATHHLVQERT